MSQNKILFFCSIFFSLVLSQSMIAQVDIRNEKIYTSSTVDRLPCICESDASFSKEEERAFCEEKLKEFMLRHLRYPEAARRSGLEGIVFVQFIVDKKGNIIEPSLINDIGKGCGQEAIRVVRLMSKWIPGLQANRPVAVKFEIPVRFSLEEERQSSGTSASPEEIAKVAGTFLFIMKKLVEKDNERKNKRKSN